MEELEKKVFNYSKNKKNKPLLKLNDQVETLEIKLNAEDSIKTEFVKFEKLNYLYDSLNNVIKTRQIEIDSINLLVQAKDVKYLSLKKEVELFDKNSDNLKLMKDYSLLFEEKMSNDNVVF